MTSLPGCSNPKPGTADDDSAAAREIVVSLKKETGIDHKLVARIADGVPGVLVASEGPEPDYDFVVGLITENEAVQSFEGEALHI